MFGQKSLDDDQLALQKRKFDKLILALDSEITDVANSKIYQNSFEWRFEFPEVLNEKGDFVGFDVVIGNPPYGRFLALEDNQKKHFITRKIDAKTGDIAENFIKLVHNGLLKSTGHFSFIVPKGLSYVKSWDDIRILFLEKLFINTLIDTSRSFTEAAYEMLIFAASYQKVDKILTGFLREDILESTLIDVKLFSKEIFYFGFPKTYLSILEKVKSNSFQVKEAFDFWYGKGGMTPSINKEGKGIKVLTGKEVQKYYLKDIEEKWFLEANLLSEEDIKRSKVDKVVVQDIVAHITRPKPHIKLTASIDNTEQFCLNTVMCFAANKNIKNEVLVALINSKFIGFYYYYFVFNQAIRTMHFMPGYADVLPISNNVESFQITIIEKVNQILALKKANPQANTSELEAEIDKMVYALYELTAEEILIVEGK
jgi:hypothetical protein